MWDREDFAAGNRPSLGKRQGDGLLAVLRRLPGSAQEPVSCGQLQRKLPPLRPEPEKRGVGKPGGSF